MLTRLASLRLWLLVATIGAATIGLAAAYVAIERLQSAQERTVDQEEAQLTAKAIAAQAQAGADAARFQAMQAVLPNDQIVVVRNRRTIFAGPALADRPLEATATAAFPGRPVIIRDPRPPRRAPPRAPTPLP